MPPPPRRNGSARSSAYSATAQALGRTGPGDRRRAGRPRGRVRSSREARPGRQRRAVADGRPCRSSCRPGVTDQREQARTRRRGHCHCVSHGRPRGSTRRRTPRCAPTAERTASGRGLAGLAERVRLVGGTMTAEPRSTGGFEVLARIPRAGGRPEPEVPAESATADERATVRRNARRGLITVVAAPVAIGAGRRIGCARLLLGRRLQLDPAPGRLRRDPARSAGRPGRAAAAGDADGRPADRPAGGQPKEWSCRFYRPDAPFSTNYAYRLCFHKGVLVAKDIMATGSVEPTPEGTP